MTRERKRAADRRYYSTEKGLANRLRKSGPALTARLLDSVRRMPGALPYQLAESVYGPEVNSGQCAAVATALGRLQRAGLIATRSRFIFVVPWHESPPVWPR